MPVSVNGVIESTEELLGQVRHLATVVDGFFEQPLPDACEALIYRCDLANQNNSYLSAFERYAARLLRTARAEELRRVWSRHSIGVGRLSATGLCWLSFDADLLTPDEQKIVLGVESAINRLMMIAKGSVTAEDVAALSSAHGEDDCMRLDWDVFSRFGSEVEAFSAAMQADNPLQSLFGVQAPKGGEWDTRTRFARYMESISAPFRLAYKFDCQVDRGLFEIHVNTLTPSIVPARRDVDTLREWTNGSPEGHRIAMAYTLRLCAFVAGAAFFSNVAITDVVVTAHRRTLDGKPVASLYFERMPYIVTAMPALHLGELAKDEASFDALTTARLLSPSQCVFAFDEEGRARYIEPLEIDFDERHVPTAKDGRPIPAELRGLLHADRVCDLDIHSVEDASTNDRVRSAAIDMEEYPVASLAEFDEILSHEAASPKVDSLYCADEVSRVLMGLRDSSEIRYRKYPDCYFLANRMVSSINETLGDLAAAEVYAQRALEVAPTSVVAYGGLATIQLETGKHAEAEHTLELGLCYAVDQMSIHYLYYRLAFALFKQGKTEVSIAVYVYLIDQGGQFEDAAKKELAQVLAAKGSVHVPSVARAKQVMEREGFPMAPTGNVLKAVAEALVGLVEMGAYPFASALCWSISAYLDRDVLTAVTNSLNFGVGEQKPLDV